MVSDIERLLCRFKKIRWIPEVGEYFKLHTLSIMPSILLIHRAGGSGSGRNRSLPSGYQRYGTIRCMRR